MRVESVVSSVSDRDTGSHGKHISSSKTIDFGRFEEGRDLDEDAFVGRDFSVSLDLADSAFDDVSAACFL